MRETSRLSRSRGGSGFSPLSVSRRAKMEKNGSAETKKPRTFQRRFGDSLQSALRQPYQAEKAFPATNPSLGYRPFSPIQPARVPSPNLTAEDQVKRLQAGLLALGSFYSPPLPVLEIALMDSGLARLSSPITAAGPRPSLTGFPVGASPRYTCNRVLCSRFMSLLAQPRAESRTALRLHFPIS
jgi:hypothetical protein